MADIAFPVVMVSSPAHVQGRLAEKFGAIYLQGIANPILQDYRIANRTNGVISAQVVVKSGGVELPFKNARVWLFRAADGFKAWHGFSDAAGNYTATGLELGVAYLPLAFDPYGNQKTTAAGPVVAT